MKTTHTNTSSANTCTISDEGIEVTSRVDYNPRSLSKAINITINGHSIQINNTINSYNEDCTEVLHFFKNNDYV